MSEIASSSKAAVYVAPYTTGDHSWQTCTLTSCNIKEAPNTVESARIRADRNPTGSFTTTRSSSGDIADEVSYGGTTDTFLEALMCSTWATAGAETASTISIGTTEHLIDVLKEFGDLPAGAGRYELYDREQLNQAAFSMTPDGLVSVTWSFVGRQMSIPDYESVTATAAAATDPMKGVATLATVDGSAYAYVTQLDITVTNNITTTNFLNYGIDTSLGKVGITGTLTIGHTSATFTEKYISDDTINLGWTLSDPAGNKYIFTLPKVRLGVVPTDINGSDSIKSGIEISAAYDGTTGVAMTIERRPA